MSCHSGISIVPIFFLTLWVLCSLAIMWDQRELTPANWYKDNLWGFVFYFLLVVIRNWFLRLGAAGHSLWQEHWSRKRCYLEHVSSSPVGITNHANVANFVFIHRFSPLLDSLVLNLSFRDLQRATFRFTYTGHIDSHMFRSLAMEFILAYVLCY